jgi:hypothetical protein
MLPATMTFERHVGLFVGYASQIEAFQFSVLRRSLIQTIDNDHLNRRCSLLQLQPHL